MSNSAPLGQSVEPDEAESQNGMSFTRWVMIGAGALGGITLLVLVIGVILALIDSSYWAPRISSIRDLVIIVVVLEFILIIAALTVLILQVARLINLLQNEIKPILENTKETVDTAKGTAQFVGKNVAQPVVKAGTFFAGLRVFLREWGGIRRALNQSRRDLSKVQREKAEQGIESND